MPQRPTSNDVGSNTSHDDRTRKEGRKKMAQLFNEQQRDRTDVFSQSMIAMEAEAAFSHSTREADVSESLHQISGSYEAAAAQRRLQWSRAEQDMREASATREAERREIAQLQERTRQMIAVNPIDEYRTNGKENVARLKETVGNELRQLGERISVLISQHSSQPLPRAVARFGLKLPSRVLLNSWKRPSELQISKPSVSAVPDEQDIDGCAGADVAEDPYVADSTTGNTNSPQPTNPPTTELPSSAFNAPSFDDISAAMQEAFGRDQGTRSEQFKFMQEKYDNMRPALDELFVAKQAVLGRWFLSFLGDTMKLEGEKSSLLAVGSAVMSFKAAENSRNSLYAKSITSIAFAADQAMDHVVQELASMESHMFGAGLLIMPSTTWSSRIYADEHDPPRVEVSKGDGYRGEIHNVEHRTECLSSQYSPEVSGPSLFSLPSRMFSKGLPIMIPLEEEWSRFEAAQTGHAKMFEQSQATRMKDAAGKEQARRTAFIQMKSMRYAQAIEREAKRWSLFTKALESVRKQWRHREIARAETFETKTKELGDIFSTMQAKREDDLEKGLTSMEKACNKAFKDAMQAFHALLDKIEKEGVVMVEWDRAGRLS